MFDSKSFTTIGEHLSKINSQQIKGLFFLNVQKKQQKKAAFYYLY